MKKSKIKELILKLSFSIILISAIIIIGYLLMQHFGITDISKEELRDMIAKTGALSKIIFIIISFLQVSFVPIPGAITILAGNLLFGFWASFAYSLIGMFLGAVLAFYLGRWIGKPFVYWVVGDKNVTNKYLKRIEGKETVTLFFMFLLPMFPDDALCSVAGITNMSFFTFFLTQIITRPISILATLLFMSGEIIPYNALGFTIIAVVSALAVTLFIIAYKNSDKINNFLLKISSGKDKKNK